MNTPLHNSQFARNRSHKAGSTLLLALWALLFLSAVVFAWTKFINQGIDAAGQANLAMEARALAHSGVEVALHPLVTGTSPLLIGSFGGGRSYRATIKGDGGKINLNYMLAGEDPNRILFLKQYLTQHGLKLQERNVFMDCLLDWVSPASNTHRLNGATDDTNYHPSHKPLLTLDEVPKVKGSAPLVSNPKWQDDFTLMSTGPLDLECVSADILGQVPGIGMDRAQRFVAIRQEPDQLPDPKSHKRAFKDLNEALSYLGISPQMMAQSPWLGGFFDFHDPIVRIHSVGSAGNVDRQVDVIARKVPGANPEILQWTEK